MRCIKLKEQTHSANVMMNLECSFGRPNVFALVGQKHGCVLGFWMMKTPTNNSIIPSPLLRFKSSFKQWKGTERGPFCFSRVNKCFVGGVGLLKVGREKHEYGNERSFFNLVSSTDTILFIHEIFIQRTTVCAHVNLQSQMQLGRGVVHKTGGLPFRSCLGFLGFVSWTLCW